MGFKKLYGPEISRYLPCMLQFFGQFLDNLRRVFIFSNYIMEIHHRIGPFEKVQLLMPDFLKSFSLWTIRKKEHNEREFKRQIIYGILGLLKKSSKTREAFI